ncbi:iron chelate uptake ABC transporter family permease subunit [Neogemmobacter tilapiae]|uniref:ABC transporter permease n=1 Tax=Neogemmobacter tilapiae TaxID=875041 RepID=A0A918TW43_9RHOB|nr:iron chelate uptake ABC transporter family permease subunit [Gemmobacter tilapiae]GHC65417.1 ABC transporter permease [Gemmobacter tilapiae]
MARLSPLWILAAFGAALLLALALSLRFGAAEQGWADLIEARAFRSVCAMAVGAALAVVGLLLQRLTANPLADPGITGVNAGAALATIVLAYLWPGAGGLAFLAVASLGAGLAGLALWGLAGGSGGTAALSLRLPLAGLAIEALCLSLAGALILTDAEMQARYLRWLLGAIPMVPRHETAALLAIGLALVSGFLCCERLELLTLGAEQSDSLGKKPGQTVALVLGHVTVLAGASVAIAGPVAFLGLLVPLVAQGLARGNLRWAYAFALPGGAALLLLADTLGRVIARPGEVDAGIITALLGGPALILVLRRMLAR